MNIQRTKVDGSVLHPLTHFCKRCGKCGQKVSYSPKGQETIYRAKNQEQMVISNVLF